MIGQTPNHSQYFEIDSKGLIALKSQYRGLECTYKIQSDEKNYSISDRGSNIVGSLNYLLPEHLYIPKTVNNKEVSGLQPRAFANNLQLKEITLHQNIKTLPLGVFYGANQLHHIYHTNEIKTIEEKCIAYTSLYNLDLSNLSSSSESALADATYLQSINIGPSIKKLSKLMFNNCISLTRVEGGDAVQQIETGCFAATRVLQDLPLLNNGENIEFGNKSFLNSLINPDESDSYTNTPLQIEPGIYIHYTPLTQLNQLDTKWALAEVGQTTLNYNAGCGYFSTMHIHSMLNKKYYLHPQEFIDELYSNPNTKIYVDNDVNKISHFAQMKEFLPKMNYITEVLTNYEELTSEKYKKLCWALAEGALALTTCSTVSDENTGHYVVLYGIKIDNNNKAQMYILDSVTEPTQYNIVNHKANDLYTYIMPYENFTGPKPGCIIIYPTQELKDKIDAMFSEGDV